jgi:hypothetical protein
MAKTLASQARNGGSIPLARFTATHIGVTPRTRESAEGRRYQAWSVPQCGHSTEVLTGAVNT